MNRKDLITAVAAQVGEGKTIVNAVVLATVDQIGAALVRGERVEIHKLGVFFVKDRFAKKGRNPRTGEPVAVPAARVVRFRPAVTVRRAVAR